MTAWFEDLPLDFTKDETRQAEKLLITAYPMNMSALNLAMNAGLNVAQLNQMVAVKFLMRDILNKARQSDRLVQLLVEVLKDPSTAAIHDQLNELLTGHEAAFETAALEHKPSLATLALLPSSMEIWNSGEASSQPLKKQGFERIINSAAGFSDIASFRSELVKAEIRTAQIMICGKAKGTGFLIGKDLLLTNWHVVSSVNSSNDGVARFDHKFLPDAGNPKHGREVSFATDWLVAHSPHDPISSELGAEGPQQGHWDYALIRLEEPVGNQAIGADPTDTEASLRGHYSLNPGSYDFDSQEPILIVGHPDGRPMQLSYASPSGAKRTTHNSRLRYQTNTEGGSSGSPVFNKEWRVVALHHAAGPTEKSGDFNMKTADFNQGIPVFHIVESLRKQLDGTSVLTELGL